MSILEIIKKSFDLECEAVNYREALKVDGFHSFKVEAKKTGDREFTRVKLLALADTLNAIDVTNVECNSLERLARAEHFKEVAYSKGTAGVNAILWRGRSGTFYVLTSRNYNIYAV